MESIKEYLDKLEINNSGLGKQLKEVYINRVVYFKEDKIVYFYLTSKDIVSHELLDKFKEELMYKLDYFKDMRMKIRFTGLERKSNKDVIKKYWNNILYILKYLCPSIAGWYKQVEFLCLEEELKIKLPKGIFYERLMKKNVTYVLKTVLSEELGLDLNITIEKAVDEKVNKERLIRINDREMEEKIRALEIGKVNNCEENEEESYVIKSDVDENLIYGDNANAMIENIVELNASSGTVAVVGDIF
ncbi:PolC-type DNA polymerase III N-terminal domain-containing protein, partial [Clostridioides difficile]